MGRLPDGKERSGCGGGAPARFTGWLKYALHFLVLAGLVYAAVKYIPGAQFRRAVHRFDWHFAPLILLLSGAYMLVKGWRFVGQMREVTNVRRDLLLRAYVAGQACTLLPGGVAARAGLLSQVGIPPEESAASIALASLSDQVVLILCSLISALWFTAARTPALIILSLLTLISVLLGLEATRTWLLGLIEWLMGKVRLLDRWQGFVSALKQMASPPVLTAAVANAAFAFALMVVALWLATWGVDAQVGLPTLLLAFTLPTMLGRISAMPGGVGVTEAGMIGILNAAPGVTLEQAAAAAILFRAGTTLFAALLGGLVYFLVWRRTPEVAEGSSARAAASA